MGAKALQRTLPELQSFLMAVEDEDASIGHGKVKYHAPLRKARGESWLGCCEILMLALMLHFRGLPKTLKPSMI